MTKSEVESAIKVVMSDVIEECYRISTSFPSRDKERVLKIANEAELLMEELIREVYQIRQRKEDINNPQMMEIKRRLNQQSLDYLRQLQNLAH
jgi:hypothetical protein